MEKTATLNLRVNPTVKKNAESVLNKLGIPMSTAIDMYLIQIYLVGGIPFALKIPKAPESIDATRMTSDEIHKKIEQGYNDYIEGKTHNAKEVFTKFRAKHQK